MSNVQFSTYFFAETTRDATMLRSFDYFVTNMCKRDFGGKYSSFSYTPTRSSLITQNAWNQPYLPAYNLYE